MTEKQLQAAVLELAKRLKWMSYHTFDSRRSNPGWPDLVLCKPPRLIFAELKVGKGRVTADQMLWLDALERCGTGRGFVWTDVEWQAGEVERVLRWKHPRRTSIIRRSG